MLTARITLTCLLLSLVLFDCSEENLQHDPPATPQPAGYKVWGIEISGGTREIKNGGSATYAVVVTVLRDAGFSSPVAGTVELKWRTLNAPLMSGVFLRRDVTIEGDEQGSSPPIYFTLQCAPALGGPGHTLRAESVNTMRGGRVVLSPCTGPPGCGQPCTGPDGCGQPPLNIPCTLPSGCGPCDKPLGCSNTPQDDPVQITATFTDNRGRTDTREGNLYGLLCVP